MKTKLLLLTALFISFYGFTQTNGWYLYTKASTIHKIIPDDTNTNELHLATDIGYIKYNTTTNTVTNFLNLTSQNPAIGHVNGLSLNPTNTDIALALDNGFAIYNGTTVTIYNYTNSALTVGSVGGTQFTKLEVRYGRQGELYIFKPDVTGYQLFNAGVFDVEVVTAIRPQDIIENQAGTKVFFAGWNDGLHMLEKATTTWTNYTTANSVLITNPLLSLQVDMSDVLYIGSFQGLNTMDSSGVWNTFQQNAPPPNASFFLPVYEISIDEITGDLLIRTSKPGTSFFGLSMVDLPTNTWTNYTSDNINCLNANVFTASTFDANGKIYVTPQDNSNPGGFFEFVPGTNTCTPLDINYLNAPIAANSSQISGITTRTKTSGAIDIGFTQGENLHILEIDPATYNGTFPTATTMVPSPGKSVFSVLSDNDYFVIENNTGWTFVDGNNTITSFNHNLPSYLAIVTQKAAAFNSSNGIINLVHKGFDAAFNYRVYKTQCDIPTAACSVPEEIFTTNRDLNQNIFYRCRTNNGGVTCLGVKTLPTSGGVGIESGVWDAGLNNPFSQDFDESLPFVPDNNNPLVLFDEMGNIIFGVLQNSSLKIRDVDSNGNPFYTPSPIDINNDGQEDKILNSSPQEVISGQVNEISFIGLGPSVTFFQTDWLSFNTQVRLSVSVVNEDDSSFKAFNPDFDIKDVKLIGVEGGGFFFFRTKNKKAAATNEALLVLLTNYGMLIKAGINVSNLTLSTGDVTLNNNNLLLYPNPANDIVSFSVNTIKSVEVYDINGRKVLSTTNSSSFSVKTLAQGVYIVKGTNNNNVIVTKKLIVE